MLAQVAQWEHDAEKPKTFPPGCFNRRADAIGEWGRRLLIALSFCLLTGRLMEARIVSVVLVHEIINCFVVCVLE